MQVTEDIVRDLLPVYFSDECSQDTRKLVDEYIHANPAFGKEAESFKRGLLARPIPAGPGKNAEMQSLRKTKRMLRVRGTIMGLAIFFTLAPFSVYRMGSGGTHWLFLDSPAEASIYGLVGIALWVTYFVMRRRARVL